MLFHFIQANFLFYENFDVFNQFKDTRVVYAGMQRKQTCIHGLLESNSRMICDMSKGQSRILRDIEKA